MLYLIYQTYKVIALETEDTLKEKLYTIPVNDAFATPCECPVCKMKKTLETDAIDYTMGPSYMEDDIREETNRLGFCGKHVKMLYGNQNRLGLALMLKTHMDKTIDDLTALSENAPKVKGSLFKKTVEHNSVKDYVDTLDGSCFVCNRIENTFNRYLITMLHLYKTDKSFQDKLNSSKGLCTTHYSMLYDLAATNLSGDTLTRFYNDINKLYIDNMKRVRDDLDWFISKFDYRFANEPWKNSKDALPRAITKTNSIVNELQ